MINFLRIIEEKYNNPGPAYDRFYKKKQILWSPSHDDTFLFRSNVDQNYVSEYIKYTLSAIFSPKQIMLLQGKAFK